MEEKLRFRDCPFPFQLYASDLEVKRSVVWQGENGAVFQTGWWDSRVMHNVHVHNIDVIHTDWCAF